MEAAVERAKKRTVGNPFDPANEQGPQVSRLLGIFISQRHAMYAPHDQPQN